MALSGFVDKRRGTNFTNSVLSVPANYSNVAAVKARLGVINGAYWTTTRLATTNVNDLVYALRLADDPTGI